jgi:hypothetical protein
MSDYPTPIGITGRATAGKDSVGKVLVKEYGYTRVAFADALKSMALALNPIVTEFNFPKRPHRLVSLVNVYGWDEAKTQPEVRRFLQVLGTEGVREHIGEDAWVEALRKTMFDLQGDGKELFVITDVRFPNEAEWVHAIGGQMWRVCRDVPLLEHASERYVDTLPCDLEIDNNGPKEELRLHVPAALGGYLDDVLLKRAYQKGLADIFEQALKREEDRW